MENLNNFKKKSHLSFMNKVVFGVGGFTDNIIGNLLIMLVFPIYNIGLKIDAAWIGVILLLPRIWDAISDPIMGNISDNTRTKIGRRRPYLFLGALTGFLCCWLVFTPPVGLGKNVCMLYLLIMSLAYYTAFTIWGIPYNSLSMELSSDYNERTSIQGYKMFFISLAALAVLPFPIRLIYYKGFGETEVEAVRVVAFLLGMMVFFSGLIPAIFCRENEQAQHQPGIKIWPAIKATFKNKSFRWLAGYIFAFSIGLFGVVQLVTYINIYYICGADKTLGAKYYSYYLMAAGVMSIIGIPIVVKISSLIGKRRTVMMGICITILTSLTSWYLFNPKYPYLQLLLPVLGTLGSMPMCMLLLSMLADVTDEDELETGLRREGMYMAIHGWIFKIGATIVTLINGLTIKFSGFNPEVGGAQPAEVILKLRLLYILFPIPFLLAGFFCIWKFPITKKKLEEIQSKLTVLRQKRQENDCGGNLHEAIE